MRLFLILLISVVLSITFTSCATTVRTSPTKVIIVKKIPRAHRVVYVNGHQYYKWNGKHYRKTTKGYVFVRL